MWVQAIFGSSIFDYRYRHLLGVRAEQYVSFQKRSDQAFLHQPPSVLFLSLVQGNSVKIFEATTSEIVNVY